MVGLQSLANHLDSPCLMGADIFPEYNACYAKVLMRSPGLRIDIVDKFVSKGHGKEHICDSKYKRDIESNQKVKNRP